MNAKWIIQVALVVSTVTLAAAAQAGEAASYLAAKTTQIIKRDFRDKGIAKAHRVNQERLAGDVQQVCGHQSPTKVEDKLKADQAKVIKYPADGKYMGDWKAGEKLAQSGKGMTWKPTRRMSRAAATAITATAFRPRKSPMAPSAPACCTTARRMT